MDKTSTAPKIITLKDGFFVRFGLVAGKEKLSFGLRGSGKHCTITNNEARRVINLHITGEGPNAGPTEYLCELSYFTFKRLLIKLRSQIPELYQKHWFSRSVNLGRLKRHGLIFSIGNPPPAVEQALATVKNNNFKTRKEVDYDKLKDIIKLPGDIPSDPSSFYFLFATRGKRKGFQGIIIKDPANPSRPRYFLITRKMLNQFSKEYISILYVSLNELEFKFKDKLVNLLQKAMSPTKR